MENIAARARVSSVSAVLVAAVALGGCGLGLYELPDPPPESEWTSVSLIPGQDDKDDAQRYIAARAAILSLYEALNEEDFSSAWELFSSETQEMLNFGAKDGNGLTALEQGTIAFPGGEPVSFDPVDLFVIRDLRTLEDEREGVGEAETARRKEVFATARDGRIKRIVVIFEAGQWRIHRTKVTSTTL